jgi:hypothetical protein
MPQIPTPSVAKLISPNQPPRIYSDSTRVQTLRQQPLNIASAVHPGWDSNGWDVRVDMSRLAHFLGGRGGQAARRRGWGEESRPHGK